MKVQPLKEARAEFSQVIALLISCITSPKRYSYHRKETTGLHCHAVDFPILPEKQDYLEQAEMSHVKILTQLSFFLSYRQLQDHWRTTKEPQTL